MKITLKAKTVDDRIFQVFTFVLEVKKKNDCFIFKPVNSQCSTDILIIFGVFNFIVPYPMV